MSKLLDKINAAVASAPKNSNVGAALWRQGVRDSDELKRIFELPRRTLDPAKVPDLSPIYVHTERCAGGCDLCKNGPAHLLPLQSAVLLEAEALRGAIGSLPVGKGKTLLSMLLFDALGCQRGALLVPSDVKDQLVNIDIPRYARHFHLPTDRFTVVSYQQLQIVRTADALEKVDPDGIVADEAHLLRHKNTARFRRFRECIKNRPGIPFVPLSGTFSTRKLTEVGHLSEMALRRGSPYPVGFRELSEWGDALDAKKESDPNLPPGKLLKFCNEEERAKLASGEMSGKDAAGQAFRRRLIETPGVIATGVDDLGVSLIIRKRELLVPKIVTDVIQELQKAWKLGDDEIDSPMTMAAFLRQMSCGFYSLWDWPGGVKDREWLEARSNWNRGVRQYLQHAARPGLDSPLLIANATARGALPSLKKAWEQWVLVKDRPQPPTKTIWLSDFMVRDVESWTRESEEGAIVWYAHTALEEPLSKLMPVFGAGTSKELVDIAAQKVIDKRYMTMALSINAHRQGKNLQKHWSRCYTISCPANGLVWEQALGRIHRQGQEADTVTCDVPLHTEAVKTAWEQALSDAWRMQYRSLEGPQKLNYAQRVGL